MFEPATPQPRFHRSLLEAADEHLAAGEEHFAGTLMWPADDTFAGKQYSPPASSRPRSSRSTPSSSQPTGIRTARVPRTSSPRPRCGWPTDFLLEVGGHIGYSVRPSARCRGHASRALGMMLPICAEMGIDQVLVTCDDDNTGSRRVIENNRGVLEDVRGKKLRFWVPVG